MKRAHHGALSVLNHHSEYTLYTDNMEIKIKKGLDLPLAGAVAADATTPVAVECTRVAVVPDDFPGFIPKVDVREGDVVGAGQPLMHHKSCEAIKLVSPVSGTVAAVVRGERRKVLRVVVDAKGAATDTAAEPRFELTAASSADRIADVLARSGMLAMMRQRPYDIVPNPADRPRDIFVTAFDSAPLAVSRVYTAADAKVMALAVEVLKVLTPGSVYVSRRSQARCADIPGAVMVDVAGPHPASLAGVQIANIKPVNKGEKVWTMHASTLYNIGLIVRDGHADFTTRVAVTGPEVKTPYVAATVMGAQIEPLVKGRLKDGDHKVRVIAGNVLTGVHEEESGYLRFPYTQVTVIADGSDKAEFMGWASMSPAKMSVSPSYPGHWLRRLFSPDARIQGGRRAMIMSGEYERYLPMDILPEYLLKAVQSGNIEAMERLGIYEVAPEDFALAEYADSSKQPLQQMVRNGLDYLRHEVE